VRLKIRRPLVNPALVSDGETPASSSYSRVGPFSLSSLTEVRYQFYFVSREPDLRGLQEAQGSSAYTTLTCRELISTLSTRGSGSPESGAKFAILNVDRRRETANFIASFTK
jgi:hypothetical protein